MKNRIILFLFFFNIVIVRITFGQGENQSKINIVNYYGIHDRSTVDYLSELLRDTNNIAFLMDFNFLYFQEIKENHDLSGLISHECDSNFNELAKFNNLYGGGLKGERESLKSVDFKSNKIQFEIDSLIKLTTNDTLLNKKYYFLYSTYDFIDGTNNFINEFKKSSYSVSMFIVLKGSKNQGNISLLNFKNKIKGSNKKQPFQTLDFKDLPRKVKLDKDYKIDKINLRFCKFIYVPKLDNCRW